MKRKKFEEEKRRFLSLFEKFERVSPQTQARVIQMVSDIIEAETEPNTKSFFTEVKALFVDMAKTEVKTDEK